MDTSHREWALIGARTRLAELKLELERIFSAFPQLRREYESVGRGRVAPARRGMSPEARQAASERMKAYWAKQGKSRRKMSAAAKRKMSAGMKRYWAERKAKQSA